MSKKAMSDPQTRRSLMKKTKDLAPYIKMASQRGVDDAVVVETSRVVRHRGCG